ncbi:thioesterase family protein [Simiduia curdlanivorans]|uniref:Acyl-CoA thioesterase n=1 Tax=Simiduia curdlanivorans TaxID=1492769 RepID=A0ABV8V526_9GAMM|nr:thioesterase family protein [Simiduia curdlanivorans]MDN3638317.1 thioesterase family protein [Simiduia curdlanivorans]
MAGAGNFDFPHPFTQPLVVEAGHIDGLNHANNAVYVQWCEAIAWAHSQALGLSIEDYQRLDRAMAIHKAEYDYLKPALLSEQLVLATWLTGSDGKLNMTRQFQLLRGQDTLMRGQWRLVCIEMSSGRARRMPEAFLQAYEPALVGVPHE